jgi:glycyl-tRNA synthetase (class II)
MTLLELKKKVLGMIEELNPDNPLLTDDPDISTKINDVINQIMFELVRMKKIPKYVEMDVAAGDVIEYADIEKECGYEVYQVAKVGGIRNEMKANGTIIKALESGTAEIECFVYPEAITAKTNNSYEFELSADVLEIMPYGVAADLLKSDVSADYGAVYAQRYAELKNGLDPRYMVNSIYIDGGVSW